MRMLAKVWFLSWNVRQWKVKMTAKIMLTVSNTGVAFPFALSRKETPRKLNSQTIIQGLKHRSKVGRDLRTTFLSSPSKLYRHLDPPQIQKRDRTTSLKQ